MQLLAGSLNLLFETLHYLPFVLELFEKSLKLLQLFVLSLEFSLQCLAFLLQLVHLGLIVLLVLFKHHDPAALLCLDDREPFLDERTGLIVWFKLCTIVRVAHEPFLLLYFPPLIAQLLCLRLELLDELASLSLVPLPLFFVSHSHLL